MKPWKIVKTIDSRLIDELSARNLQRKYSKPNSSGQRSSGFNQTRNGGLINSGNGGLINSRNGGGSMKIGNGGGLIKTGNASFIKTGNGGGLIKTVNGSQSFENFNRGISYSQSPTVSHGLDDSMVK